MEQTTAQYLFDRLQELDAGSNPYSRRETLYDENLRGFSASPLGYPNLGAFLLSDRTISIWLVIVDWRNSKRYQVVLYTDKKHIIIQISGNEVTYKPSKRDGKNRQRKDRFLSLFGSNVITLPLPGPDNDVGIDEFLNRVFDLANGREWSDKLENEPAPKLKSFPGKDAEATISHEGTTDRSMKSEIHMTLNTILYGPPGTGKTYATFRRCVDICDGRCPGEPDKIRARYKELVEEGRIEFVTFHQSYGYEEFVEGLRPDTGSAQEGEEARAGFRLVATDGVLKRIAERARGPSRPAGEAKASADPKPHVLVIDEINRANVSKVMGELITLLEEDKREGAENEIAVTLPHSGDRFTLPANLYVLGTMNTADRSIALLDTALRRRFEFEELAPAPGLLGGAAEATGIDLPDVLRAINERLEYLVDRDHLIGHAWLMGARTKADVDRIMRHKLIPLIAEYFYDDWQKVQAVLGGTDDFVRGEKLNPPPGLDDTDVDEDRRLWTVRDEFEEGAYDRLIAGQAQGPE